MQSRCTSRTPAGAGRHGGTATLVNRKRLNIIALCTGYTFPAPCKTLIASP